jgi:hypothetical protein
MRLPFLRLVSLQLIILSLILLMACKHDPEVLSTVDPIDTTGIIDNTSHCSPDTIYFEQQVLPLLRSGCAKSGCHDVASHKEGIVLDSYSSILGTGGINLSNPTNSKIYRAMVNSGEDRMPPSPAPAFNSDQLLIVSKWIGQGANDNSCLESGCDTVNIAYSTHIKPLIQNNCIGCHSGSNPGGGIGLSVYNDVKTIADNGKFMGSIDHLSGYSPKPKNGNKLTDCQINMVKIWINNGAPDN